MKYQFVQKCLTTVSFAVLGFTSLAYASQDETPLGIPRPLSITLSKQEAIGIHFPSELRAEKEYNPDIVKAYRHHIQSYKGNNKARAIVEHCEALIPLANKLERYIKVAAIDHPVESKKLLSEIALRKQQSKVDPLWIFGIHLRVAAAISEVSADEKDLMLHVVNPNMFTGLLEDQAWGDHFTTFASMGIADDRDQHITESYYGQNLAWGITDKIDEELIRYFPISTYYPLSSFGHFGVNFLISRYLENVFPMALSRQKVLDAHGTKVSKVSFIVHDALHGDVDPRRRALKSHIYKRTDDFVGLGGSAVPFVKFYTPQAVRKYNLVMGALQEIQNDFLAYLLPHYGKREFQTAMAGFFLPIHELLVWSPNTFENNDLDVIIENLIEGTKKAFMSQEVWESPFDPLKTSPLDGKSSLTKRQIIEYAFENDLINNPKLMLPSSYYKNHPLPDRTTFIKEKLIAGVRVVKSPRFIDVEFDTKSGQSLRATYPTLYHKWHNMDDSLGLLKMMAGIEIPKPDLEAMRSLEETRLATKSTLVAVRKELLNLLDYFKVRALFFANYKNGDGVSLADRYFRSHFNQEKKIQEVIAKVLPKPAEENAVS